MGGGGASCRASAIYGFLFVLDLLAFASTSTSTSNERNSTTSDSSHSATNSTGFTNSSLSTSVTNAADSSSSKLQTRSTTITPTLGISTRKSSTTFTSSPHTTIRTSSSITDSDTELSTTSVLLYTTGTGTEDEVTENDLSNLYMTIGMIALIAIVLIVMLILCLCIKSTRYTNLRSKLQGKSATAKLNESAPHSVTGKSGSFSTSVSETEDNPKSYTVDQVITSEEMALDDLNEAAMAPRPTTNEPVTPPEVPVNNDQQSPTNPDPSPGQIIY